eukprot:TRINITY_DN18796_c0_g1_i1.p1 TRINITY_DN18796_c0_g1~~TRINITY_DN18796_c0_g1_i1.p1  ORF type:complete len:111 (-),score=8.89 TRINITY_DN18796_c0_g1_i1:50-382(-)
MSECGWHACVKSGFEGTHFGFNESTMLAVDLDHCLNGGIGKHIYEFYNLQVSASQKRGAGDKILKEIDRRVRKISEDKTLNLGRFKNGITKKTILASDDLRICLQKCHIF